MMKVRVIDAIRASETHIYAIAGFIKYYFSHQSNTVHQLASVDHHFVATIFMTNNLEQIVVL